MHQAPLQGPGTRLLLGVLQEVNNGGFAACTSGGFWGFVAWFYKERTVFLNLSDDL